MIDRRRVLVGCAACVVVGCARHASDSAPAPTPSCDDGASVEGWVPIPLADYPALAEVGGWAEVDLPEHLLVVVVAQPEPGCFVAIWRVCTHGACEVDWDPASATAVCPCHGSVFAADGSVLVGPATEPVRAFPVVRRGDVLWLQR